MRKLFKNSELIYRLFQVESATLRENFLRGNYIDITKHTLKEVGLLRTLW